MAADLIGRQVAVIGSWWQRSGRGSKSPRPSKFRLSSSVSGSENPVKDGLVASLNRLGGNVTGISVTTSALGPKHFVLLHEFVPKASVVGVLLNPLCWPTSKCGDVDDAFVSLVQQKIGALFVANDPFLTDRRLQIVALAAHNAIPVMYSNRVFADAGGLVSYGANFFDGYKQAGNNVGQILKGENQLICPYYNQQNSNSS